MIRFILLQSNLTLTRQILLTIQINCNNKIIYTKARFISVSNAPSCKQTKHLKWSYQSQFTIVLKMHSSRYRVLISSLGVIVEKVKRKTKQTFLKMFAWRKCGSGRLNNMF